MNSYKYFLLKHIDLIDDIKGIITNYAKIRIITPPSPIKLFESNGIPYVYDNIIYHTGYSFMLNYVYTDTYFHVKNNKIMYILFHYYAPDKSIYYTYTVRVDFCNIKIISLYTLYDLRILPDIDTPHTNIELDGLYFTKDHIVFIVES